MADYWADDVASYTMDEQGHLSRALFAKRAKHFPSDDHVELVNLQLKLIGNPREPPWKVQAQTGSIFDNGELVHLRGTVTATRDASAGSLPIRIVTEYMQIKPKVQYAETDQLVHMINGPHWIKSVGLQAW
ncbi:hypothetical protein TI03_06985, partial [Achromatium sp. WMS1]